MKGKGKATKKKKKSYFKKKVAHPRTDPEQGLSMPELDQGETSAERTRGARPKVRDLLGGCGGGGGGDLGATL